MIKEFYEKWIKELEMDKEKKVAPLKDRIMREKIAPYNVDIDSSRAKALTEVDNKYNLKIAELKKACEAEKQELIVLGEKNKKENAEAVFASELAPITMEYDSAIAKLKAQLAEIKE